MSSKGSKNEQVCVLANEDIRQGEVVVQLPDDAVLMVENCFIADILEEEGLSKPAEDPILEVQGLIMAVMYEKSIGSRSRWAPYLDFLPADMSHLPMFWKKTEFEELRGTVAYDKMMGEVQHPADAPTKVDQLWKDIVRPFVREHPELQLPDDAEGYELYRWATAAVSSYSFILGDDHYQAMVPIWDALNHITGKANIRLHHCAKRGVLQMIATRDIKAGEEVVNNYGELSSSELLRAYGFVERDNCYSHVQVPLSFIIAACRLVLSNQHPHASSDAGTRADTHDNQSMHTAQGTIAGVPSQSTSLANSNSTSRNGSHAHMQQFTGRRKREPQHSDQLMRGSKRPKQIENDLPRQAVAGENQQSPKYHNQPHCCACSTLNHATDRPAVIPHLQERLSLCRRCKFIPKNKVFKLFSGHWPPDYLTALIHMMLLSQEEFEQLQAEVATWQAPRSKPFSNFLSEQVSPVASTSGISAPQAMKHKTHLQSELHRRSMATCSSSNSSLDKTVSADVHIPSIAVATTAHGGRTCNAHMQGLVASVYQQTADFMLSRYTCTYEQDKQLAARMNQLSPRLQAALVARMQEKHCLKALHDWALDQQANNALPLLAQSASAWDQALGTRGKAGTTRGMQDKDGHHASDTHQSQVMAHTAYSQAISGSGIAHQAASSMQGHLRHMPESLEQNHVVPAQGLASGSKPSLPASTAFKFNFHV